MTTRKSSFRGIDNMVRILYKIVCIMIILLITIPISMAVEVVSEREVNWTYAKDFNEQSIAWVEYSIETLKWGDKMKINDWALGNFTIELTDIMKDAAGSKLIGALMTVTREDKKSHVVISSDESQIVTFDPPFNNEMKISASLGGGRIWSREVFEPNVSVQVFLRGKPDINIYYNIYTENPEINPDLNVTDNIQSNKLFYIQVSLNNKGKATLKNVLLDINLTDFKFPQEQDVRRQGMNFKIAGNSIVYNLNDIKVNDTTILNLSVIAPTTPVNKIFSLPIILTGSDEKNVIYTYRTKQQLIIKPFIEISKNVGSYINYSGTDVLYVGEKFSTNINIKNHANQNVTINLIDFVPETFEYQTNDNKSLNWNVTIQARASHTITYSIKPVRYKETVTIPKATASFEFNGTKYTVESNDLVVKVKGSDVLLTKETRIDQQSNGIINLTIRIKAQNLGDQRVSLKINDSLPDNASLINGTLSKDSFYLEKNELFIYFYEISVPEEDRIFLPSATGYILDFRTYLEKDSRNKDYWRKIESNLPIIDTRPPAPITPENTSQDQNNITLPTQEKEESKTKLGIIRNFIREFIKFILGEKRAEETVQPTSLPEAESSIKRIEETHSSFTYSLGWESQSNASGGTWKISETVGSRVAVSFTGTGVALLYSASPEGGIANIDLDGKGYPDIDMYSPVPESGINRTIASGLENTRHILTITVSSNKNPSSSNSMVVVDAVEITQP